MAIYMAIYLVKTLAKTDGVKADPDHIAGHNEKLIPFVSFPGKAGTQPMNGHNYGKPAPLWRRFAAMLYDALLLTALLFILSIPVTVLFGITLDSPWYGYYRAWLFLMWFFYFGWFWVNGGQTLGMKSWGVRIVSTRAGKMSWLQAATRFAVALVSALALGLGFFWGLFREDKATWHDLASDTRLVLQTMGSEGSSESETG